VLDERVKAKNQDRHLMLDIPRTLSGQKLILLAVRNKKAAVLMVGNAYYSKLSWGLVQGGLLSDC